MKYAIDVPTFGPYANPRLLAEMARDAEAAGWDGFFLWDHIALPWPDALGDVTVALTAIALATERIRFGALVTPLPRRRPAKFARETATLDRLSGGRLTVGVGLGIFDGEFGGLGEPAELRERAALLDEGLEVLTGLWAGGDDPAHAFTHHGAHYTVEGAQFWPKPVQQPRPPVWVAATWPNRAPLRRAARWDGVVPMVASDDMRVATPAEIRGVAQALRDLRGSDAPFDIAAAGYTPAGPQQAEDVVAPYAEAGATWWLEDLTPIRYDWQPGPGGWPLDKMRDRVRQGPPRLET